MQLLAQLLYGLHLLPAAGAQAGAGSDVARIAAVVLQALGLGSVEGLSVGYILLVSNIGLVGHCSSHTVQPEPAQSVHSSIACGHAAQSAHPCFVDANDDRMTHTCCLRSVTLQMLSAPLFCLLAATAEAAEARQVTSALRAAPPQVFVRSGAQCLSGTPAGTTRQATAASGVSVQASAQASAAAQQSAEAAGGAPGASAGLAQAAVATSVAAFSPQLSVPLTLGLQYTNSGVLTALCLFWVAVLWPR
jgi:hypothetical protein